MKDNAQCIFCHSKCEEIKDCIAASTHYKCEECGEYEITYSCLSSSRVRNLIDVEKLKISKYLKQQSGCTKLYSENIERILAP
ncbi:MAG: hypothetical protein JJE17_00380 [Peptostreptococcaceae bacterium]|nr:hypothetical protein [Peptostreptococcaceae bacterium]